MPRPGQAPSEKGAGSSGGQALVSQKGSRTPSGQRGLFGENSRKPRKRWAGGRLQEGGLVRLQGSWAAPSPRGAATFVAGSGSLSFKTCFRGAGCLGSCCFCAWGRVQEQMGFPGRCSWRAEESEGRHSLVLAARWTLSTLQSEDLGQFP